MPKSFVSELDTVPIQDLVYMKPVHKLVSVKPLTPVSVAFELLAENNVLSCPVIQRDEGGPEVLLGFIDVLHLLEIITDITARQLKTRRGSSVALDHENLDFRSRPREGRGYPIWFAFFLEPNSEPHNQSLAKTSQAKSNQAHSWLCS